MFHLLAVPMRVAYHVVATLASWFSPLPGGMATAAAIIVFTAAVRLALLPLSYYAMRGETARTALLARVPELRRRYARQPDRLQRELAALYKSSFVGFLPLLLQLPFFSVMYRLFLSRTVGGAPNTLLTHRLFGAPLGAHLLTAGLFSQPGLVFLGLFALLALVAWYGTRMARRAAAPPAGLARLLPYGALVVAAVVPLAAGIYLLASTTWTMLERAVLRRKLATQGHIDP